MAKSEDQAPKKTGTERVQVKVTEVEQSLHEAPAVFVDGAHGIASVGNVIRINLYQDRLRSVMSLDDPEQAQRVICARLMMTPLTLVQIHAWLTDVVEEIKNDLGIQVVGPEDEDGKKTDE